jgi:predicted nucleic acid-binding protein
MKIYLDVCCYNRPFDDQTQERVRLEAEAIAFILLRINRGEWAGVVSEAVYEELARMPDSERRGRVLRLTPGKEGCILVQEREVSRARELVGAGFKPLDALHLACAEAAGADVFLTTDDQLRALAQRNSRALRVNVANPLTWLEERMEL